MSYWILAATVLSLLFTGAHVFGGGPDVHSPLLASAGSEVLRGYVSIIWHAVTTSMLLCTGLFFIAARNPRLRISLTLVAAVQFSSFAALFVFYGLHRLGSVWLMPQWIGFLLIVVIALVGLRPNRSVREREVKSRAEPA